jgi:hypothetical protein
MEPVFKTVLSGLITYSTHYITVKAYSYMCVPDGFLGFCSGLVTMGSPVCQVGMKIMSNTEVSYATICMMGISRLILDYVVPSAKSTTLPESSATFAEKCESHASVTNQ